MALSKKRTIHKVGGKAETVSSRWLVVKRDLSRSLRRNGLQPRTQPPDQPAEQDQSDRDQLRPCHDSAKHRPTSGIVAQELKKITRHTVQDEISRDDLPVELFPLQQPHQDEEIRQLDRRFKKLRRLQRNSPRRAHPSLRTRTGKGHAPEMRRRFAIAAARRKTTHASKCVSKCQPGCERITSSKRGHAPLVDIPRRRRKSANEPARKNTARLSSRDTA